MAQSKTTKKTKVSQPEIPYKEFPAEFEREYIYADGTTLTISRVYALHVSDSGGHYLKTEAGGDYYIKAGWLAIHFPGTDDLKWHGYKAHQS